MSEEQKNTGVATTDEKKENFFVRTWNKIPEPGRKVIAAIGDVALLGLTFAGGYALAGGFKDDDSDPAEDDSDVVDVDSTDI